MENFLTQIENIVSKSSTNKIIIFGKGASIDLINLKLIDNSIKIGLNDAEQLIDCDFSIFHDEWVLNSIKANRFKSKCYISPFNLKGFEHVKGTYFPLENDKVDLMFNRLNNLFYEDFIIEDVLFISALKLSRLIAKILGKKMDVYFIGFDFDPSKGFSKKLNLEFSKSRSNLINFKILPQEQYFLNAFYLLQNSELNLIHVGDKSYSRMNSDNFNDLFNSISHSIKSIQSKVIIVAEFTSNHFGDRRRLERMVRLAVNSGADLIKVQKRDVLSFYSKKELESNYLSPFGTTFLDYRLQLELKYDDFVFLDNLCNNLGIKWFASVLDKPSYEFIMTFNPTIIKLPSTISEHKEFINFVSSNYNGDIVVSTGMTTKNYVDYIVKCFSKARNFFLMHTNSAYPTPIEDANISILEYYKTISDIYTNVLPAYSSHDEGSFGSILAIAAGAKMIEKHVKLGNSDWAHFDSVALDLENDQFKNYVKDIRKAEKAMGDGIKKIYKSENHKY